MLWWSRERKGWLFDFCFIPHRIFSCFGPAMVDSNAMRKTFVVPDIKPLDQYDSSRARICASVGWLLAKSYGNAGIQSGRVSNPSCAAFLEGNFSFWVSWTCVGSMINTKTAQKCCLARQLARFWDAARWVWHILFPSQILLVLSPAHCSVTAEESMCEGEECVNSAFFTTQRPYERWKAAGCGPAVSYYDMHSIWLS